MNYRKFTLYTIIALLVVQFESCKKEDDDNNNTITCPATIQDVDGNVYNTIKIGNQCWMQQNLKTTRYNDSVSIPTNLTAFQWQNTPSGAYAIYDDNAANNAIYGKLYNGHAVATGKLCPKGWHVPTDQEWKTLEKFLGLSDDELNNTGERGTAEQIGGKLKALTLWDDPNQGATNSSGFSALPAGTRNSVGDFIVLKQYTDFWTSTPYETDNNYLWDHHLYYNGAGVGRIYQTKEKGYSCRCIQD